MEICLRCVGRSDRAFSFDPMPGKEEAVLDIVDHYISQMLTMIIHEIDASHDQKFQIYEYIATCHRRELMRHPGNASVRAGAMDSPVLELASNSSTDRQSSHIALSPSRPEQSLLPCRPAAGCSATEQDGTHRLSAAVQSRRSERRASRPGGGRQMRISRRMFGSDPLPKPPNGGPSLNRSSHDACLSATAPLPCLQSREVALEACTAVDAGRRAAPSSHDMFGFAPIRSLQNRELSLEACAAAPLDHVSTSQRSEHIAAHRSGASPCSDVDDDDDDLIATQGRPQRTHACDLGQHLPAHRSGVSPSSDVDDDLIATQGRAQRAHACDVGQVLLSIQD
eukprot:TRINITY_DN4311_c0_g3_i1.p1 TRINITY_DN4311_c0_g3~~TRINITY_DN4311_c0_g3_i1.p1  ORF type:complete len:338 (-),score=40.26 TRINITY_DN4311_c0_g3_i1:71-1084(-)